MEYFKKQFNSGLRAVLVPKSTSPIVTVNLSYRAGSKDEIKGKTGLAHLFEHLMFEGTPNVPKGKFDEICSAAGGTNNAYTTYDWTTYYMTMPANQLELALWLEADRLYNFKLEQEVLDVQKKVVTEEIDQTVNDRPYAKWREYSAKNAFSEDCSYSWEVQGLIKDVKSVDIDDANHFRNQFYKPANAVLSICGDLDPDNTFKLIEQYFDKNNNTSNGISRNQFSMEMRKKGNSVSFKDNVPHPAVFVSFHCDGFSESEEEYTAGIYSDIMARGKSSKLYNTLVYEKEIASHAGVFYDKRENSSLLTFFVIGIDKNISEDVLYEELMNEIMRKKSASFMATDLEKSKNFVKTKISNSLLKSTGIADTVSKKEMFDNDPSLAFNLIEKYDSVDLEDLEQFMERRLNVEELIRVNVLPGG